MPYQEKWPPRPGAAPLEAPKKFGLQGPTTTATSLSLDWIEALDALPSALGPRRCLGWSWLELQRMQRTQRQQRL